MSTTNLNLFWNTISENLILQKQLQRAPDLNCLVKVLVTLGEHYGYQFTTEEAQEYMGMMVFNPLSSLTPPKGLGFTKNRCHTQRSPGQCPVL